MDTGIRSAAKGQMEKELRHFLTLRQWLIVFLLLFLVAPLCASSIWVYFQSRRYLTQAAVRNIHNVALLEALQIQLYVERVQSVFGAMLLRDGRLADLIRARQAADGQVGNEIGDELEALRAKLQKRMPVEEIQVLSPTGTLLASTADRDPFRTDAATLNCAKNARAMPRIAGFSYDRNEPTVLLSSMIQGRQGEPRGIICVRSPFDVHRQLLIAHRERTMRASLFLLNRRGEIICGSFEDSRRAPYGRSFLVGGRAAIRLDQPWEGRYALPSGGEALSAYAPVPSLGWGVVVEIPVALALTALQRPERDAALAVLAIVLLVTTAAGWGLHIVVRPLQSLSHTAQRLVAGPTGETVTPGGSREIVQLARAFNHMSLALSESHQLLEQRIAERTREAQQSQEFVELVLNSIDHRVIVIDRSYRIVKANAAAVCVYGPDLVGASYLQTFGRKEEPDDKCAAARTFATGRPALEHRSQQMNDAREAVEIETYPVFGADGQVGSVIEIGRTVTAEKQSQMQLRYQEKMAAFGLLAAGIAHDIGNPLASIESQLQLARQQPQRRDETLSVVGKEVGRILRMLREIIDFTRRRRDTVGMVSVNQVIEDVTRLLNHDPRRRNVTIAHRLADDLPGIRTTEDHLFQVFLNLGLNGLDAMPSGGTLEFETVSRSGWIVVRVRDTGCGIPVERRAHLFEPFFTSKSQEHGSGLGLFTSKGIVEAMGGELTLESSDHRGTVFTVFLSVKSIEATSP